MTKKEMIERVQELKRSYQIYLRGLKRDIQNLEGYNVESLEALYNEVHSDYAHVLELEKTYFKMKNLKSEMVEAMGDVEKMDNVLFLGHYPTLELRIKKIKETENPTQAIEKVACEVEEPQTFTQDSIQDLYAQKIYLLKKRGELIKAIKEGRNKGLSNKSDEIKKLREEKDLLSNQCNAITDELVKRGAIIEFNDEQQPTTKESCKTIEQPTIKEETQEQSTFEKKREYNKTNMELIYNIIINNTEGFNEEYKNRAITRLYKYTDDMYTARFTLSYFYHDEKEQWIFTLKNHDGILLNYIIHKSLLDEKWLLNLCKDVNDIINNEGQGMSKSLETPQITKESCQTEKTTNFEEEKNNFKNDLMGDINVCHELLRLEGLALGIGVKSVKWNDLFCTEKDLLRALYQIDLSCYKENGQYYMQGFHKQLHNGKMLSPKQITQLKRMARFVCLHYLRDTFHKYNGKKLLKPKTK